MLRQIALCLLGCCLASALRADEASNGDTRVADIVDCVRANYPEQSAHHRITIISHDANQRVSRLQARMLWRPSAGEQNRIHVRLEEPADLADSAYLLVQTPEQESLFLYVPGLNRVRRLRGQAVAGELWGTSLNYHDFRYLYGIALNRDFVWEAREVRGALEVDRLRAEIPPAGGWGNARVRIDVERQHCVITRVAFFDAQDKLLKELIADEASIRAVNGYWMPFHVEALDHARDAQVDLKVNAAAFDEDLPAGLFESRSFYRLTLPPSP